MVLFNNVAFYPKEMIVIDFSNNSDLINEVSQKIEPEECKIEIFNEAKKIYQIENQNLKQILPFKAGINLTSSCQLKCNYCTFSSGENNNTTLDKLSIETYIKWLVKNYLIKKRTFSDSDNKEGIILRVAGGGEPTYYWDNLVTLVEYTKKIASQNKISMTLTITTNGILNTEKTKYLTENFASILVSFDGLPILQNKNRVSNYITDSFKYVNNTLKYLNDNKLDFRIRSTVWPEDFIYLNDMKKFISLNYPNVGAWEIMPVNQVGRAETNEVFGDDESANINNYNFTDYYIDLIKLNDDFTKKIVCSTYRGEYCLFECGTAFGKHPWLDSDGRIRTCLDAGDKAIMLGQIENGSIKYDDFKDELTLKHLKNKNDECKECHASFFCGGGCPLKHEVDDGGNATIQSKWDCDCKKDYWGRVFSNISKGEDFLKWKAEKISIPDIDGLDIYRMNAN